jgi:hypothetical protein
MSDDVFQESREPSRNAINNRALFATVLHTGKGKRP